MPKIIEVLETLAAAKPKAANPATTYHNKMTSRHTCYSEMHKKLAKIENASELHNKAIKAHNHAAYYHIIAAKEHETNKPAARNASIDANKLSGYAQRLTSKLAKLDFSN